MAVPLVDLLGNKQERRWHRFLGRLVARDLWRFRGLQLWLVRRPYLRFWPLPFPQCKSQEEYEANQPYSGAVKPLLYLTPDIFKELLWLRQRMGAELCWKFHTVIWESMLAAKASKTAYRRACSHANSHLALPELLGPRGGLPKTKDKLILVAEALSVPSWGTVAELTIRCREAMGRTREQTRARATNVMLQRIDLSEIGVCPENRGVACSSGFDRSLVYRNMRMDNDDLLAEVARESQAPSPVVPSGLQWASWCLRRLRRCSPA